MTLQKHSSAYSISLLALSLGMFLVVGNFIPSASLSTAPVITAHASVEKTKKLEQPRCVANPEIAIVMFHYVIPEQFTLKNKLLQGLSITPENFSKTMKKFSTLQKEGKLLAISPLELEQYSAKKCFPHNKLLILSADDGKENNIDYLAPILKKYPLPFNFAIITGKTGETVASRIEDFATKDELRELLKIPGVTLSSHTKHHTDLRLLKGDLLQKELCDSKTTLESWFGIKVNTLVYPSGKYTSETPDMVKKCGYTYAFTTNPGKAGLAHPFTLNRVRVNHTVNTVALVKKTLNIDTPPKETIQVSANKKQ